MTPAVSQQKISRCQSDLAPEKTPPKAECVFSALEGMSRTVRALYTLEFKQEAVRLGRGGQPIGTKARGPGISDQTVKIG